MALGSMVGYNDGKMEGCVDGSAVGVKDGSNEGTTDGFVVGKLEGEIDGDIVLGPNTSGAEK